MASVPSRLVKTAVAWFWICCPGITVLVRVAVKLMVMVPPGGMSKAEVVQSLPLLVKVGVSVPPATLSTMRLVVFSRPAGRTSLTTVPKAVVVPVLERVIW